MRRLAPLAPADGFSRRPSRTGIRRRQMSTRYRRAGRAGTSGQQHPRPAVAGHGVGQDARRAARAPMAPGPARVEALVRGVLPPAHDCPARACPARSRRLPPGSRPTRPGCSRPAARGSSRHTFIVREADPDHGCPSLQQRGLRFRLVGLRSSDQAQVPGELPRCRFSNGNAPRRSRPVTTAGQRHARHAGQHVRAGQPPRLGGCFPTAALQPDSTS